MFGKRKDVRFDARWRPQNGPRLNVPDKSAKGPKD